MDDWARRCEELKEGKTYLIRKILDEIKEEGNTLVTKPTELTKLFILKKEEVEKTPEIQKPNNNISEAGFDLDLCPF